MATNARLTQPPDEPAPAPAEKRDALADAPFTPVDRPDGGTQFRCALCGTRFTHGGRVCGSCPLGAACDLVSCPHCGYGFPRKSRVVDWALRLHISKSDGFPGANLAIRKE